MQETGDYTYKTDVYSLGLMLYEMHHPVCSGSEKVEVSECIEICNLQYNIISYTQSIDKCMCTVLTQALKAAKESNPPEEIKASFPHEVLYY